MNYKNKILLVEDQPIIRRVHKLFLEKMGFQVETAINGKTTLEMLTHRFYHLIILDGGLPDMSGVEVGKKIRSFERENQRMRVPIILLSAYSSQLLERWCKEGEIDSFAIKPIRYNDLFLILKNYLNSGAVAANF
ncbi:MAG: response regulator [Pseudomonadota bacterium]